MTSTNRPISRLRRRLIEDMTARKLGDKTQTAYVRAVKQLADFLGRSPASADAEDLRRFQLHLGACGPWRRRRGLGSVKVPDSRPARGLQARAARPPPPAFRKSPGKTRRIRALLGAYFRKSLPKHIRQT